MNTFPHVIVAAGDGGSAGVGLLIIIAIIALVSSIFKKSSRRNGCPKCGKDSLERASHWWHGSHIRCKHSWLCGWNELKAKETVKRQKERSADDVRRKSEDDYRERVVMLRNEADERAVREGKPKPYGY